MKKCFLHTVFSFFILIVLFMISLYHPALLHKTHSAETNFTVGVDYRIELLTIMQYLGEVNFSKPLNFAYISDVATNFYPYKSQDSVKKVVNFIKSAKSIDTPVRTILHFSLPPALELLTPIPPDLLECCGGQENIDQFMEGLRSFTNDAGFIGFMKNHQAFFDTITEATNLETLAPPYIKRLESYYGMKQHSYNIILAPFLHCGGFGPSLPAKDGLADIYSVIGPCSVKDGIPVFLSGDSFEEILYHEFSHSFVNPLTEHYSEQVNQCRKLFSPISKEMTKLRCNQWSVCLNEHLIRTFTIRMVVLDRGEEEALKKEEEEFKQGFVYIPLLLEKFKQYENKRSVFKTFKEFYPVMLEYLQEISQFPCLPTHFKLNFTGDGAISMEWQDNADDEAGYRVYRSTNNSEQFEILIELPNNKETYEDSHLIIATTYYYKVSAFNEAGEMFSSVLSRKAPFLKPEKVKNFCLEGVKGQTIHFLWEYSAKCHGFVLTEMPGEIEVAVIDSDKRAYQLELVAFGDHLFQLFAFNEWEGERKVSPEKEPVQVSVLPPPFNVQASAIGLDSIKITWSLKESSADGVLIFRSIDGGEFQLIKELGKAYSYIDKSLDQDTAYQYKLVAKKGTLIQSNDSEVVSVKTEKTKEPEPPKDVILTLRYRVGIKQYWVDDVVNKMDAAPIIQGGRVFLPIRYITNPIGAEILWDGKEQKTTIQLSGIKIELWIGNSNAKINGVNTPIDANNPDIRPMILSSRTYLPLRFVGESLGCEVQWKADIQEAVLLYRLS